MVYVNKGTLCVEPAVKVVYLMFIHKGEPAVTVVYLTRSLSMENIH